MTTTAHRTEPTGTESSADAAPRGAIPTQATTQVAHRIESTAWGSLGLTWAGYLLLRPYGDETTLAGAEGLASPAWPTSHLLGMAGFAALAVALGARAVARPVRSRVVTAAAGAAGAALVLPYYGAETFGLHAIAGEAVARGDASLIATFDAVRYGPAALTIFGIGLLLVIGVGAWSAARAARGLDSISPSLGNRAWSVALGMAVATMPLQYIVSPGTRMAHGVLVLVICGWAALAARRERR